MIICAHYTVGLKTYGFEWVGWNYSIEIINGILQRTTHKQYHDRLMCERISLIHLLVHYWEHYRIISEESVGVDHNGLNFFVLS